MQHRKRRCYLTILGVFLSLAACQREKNDASVAQFDRKHPGYQLYQSFICSRCHGADLAGTHKAPSLANIRAQYDRVTLRAYLANPDSMQRIDPRLKALNEDYKAFEMPSYPLNVEHRERLIDFLLGEQISSTPPSEP
jgi:cytochrome c553